MLMFSPSAYQHNTSFKEKGMQTNLTFSRIALIQEICCKPEDRCITTKKVFCYECSHYSVSWITNSIQFLP